MSQKPHDRTQYRILYEREPTEPEKITGKIWSGARSGTASGGVLKAVQEYSPGFRDPAKAKEWLEKNHPTAEILDWQYSILYWKFLSETERENMESRINV